jgi:hypothetical protein
MRDRQVTLRELIAGLRAEKLLADGDAALEYLNQRAEVQPWYIRTMVGFGAWLASLLLIGFVAGFSLAMDGGYAVIGLGLIFGAIWVRRRSGNDFPVQCALATSLAGQALFAFGFADLVGHEEFEIFLGFALVVSSALFFLFPDRIHRVIMVLLAGGSLIMLLYVWELNALVPVLGPVFIGGSILLQQQMPRLVGGEYGALARPLMSGLMLCASGALLLSTVYVLPELEVEFRFYPRPWISTILLGGLFLYLGTLIWPKVVGPSDAKGLAVSYGMMILVIACAWNAPGLLLGLIVIVLGAASGCRTFVGAGIGLFGVFLATYFYGIEITMLTKSMTLIATGIAILAARWVMLNLLVAPRGQGAEHE